MLHYIEQHPNAVLVSSALELAAKIEASDATVIRAIQSLGFDGLPHLKTVIAEKLDKGVRTPVEKVGVTVRELTQEQESTPSSLSRNLMAGCSTGFPTRALGIFSPVSVQWGQIRDVHSNLREVANKTQLR